MKKYLAPITEIEQSMLVESPFALSLESFGGSEGKRAGLPVTGDYMGDPVFKAGNFSNEDLWDDDEED